MTKDLDAAIKSMMVEARRQAVKGACDGCDPGNEGSEVWGELVDAMEAAVKRDKEEDVKEYEWAFQKAAKKICRWCREGVLLCGPDGVYDHETTAKDSRCKAEALWLARDELKASGVPA